MDAEWSNPRHGPLLSSSDTSWSAISLNTSSKVKCIVEWGPAVAGGGGGGGGGAPQGIVAAEANEAQV